MTTTNYEDLINQYVPNFRRFEEALDADSEIIVEIAMLLKNIYEKDLLPVVGKHINLELGLCILKDSELDQAKIKEIIASLKEKSAK